MKEPNLMKTSHQLLSNKETHADKATSKHGQNHHHQNVGPTLKKYQQDNEMLKIVALQKDHSKKQSKAPDFNI